MVSSSGIGSLDFVGRFDDVVSVLRGDEYFLESFFRYIGLLSQWSLIGIGPAYAITVLYGLPIHFLLKGLEIANLMTFLVAGALGGLLLSLFFNVKPGSALVLIACGAIVACSFRLIAKD